MHIACIEKSYLEAHSQFLGYQPVIYSGIKSFGIALNLPENSFRRFKDSYFDAGLTSAVKVLNLEHLVLTLGIDDYKIKDLDDGKGILIYFVPASEHESRKKLYFYHHRDSRVR